MFFFRDVSLYEMHIRITILTILLTLNIIICLSFSIQFRGWKFEGTDTSTDMVKSDDYLLGMILNLFLSSASPLGVNELVNIR